MNVKRAIGQAIFSPHVPKWLLAAFVAWFGAWAIGPWNVRVFLLEHVFTVGFVALLVWSYSRFRLSNLSYAAIFLFLCLHVVGAHYTYAKVPYGEWLGQVSAWFGGQNSVSRNNYDRLVHFSFGLLMAYPMREVFVRIVKVKGFWGYYLPLDVVMSLSLLYELVEWQVAVVIGGGADPSYLGAQGDVWDAQKDMALASLGGLIAMTSVAALTWRLRRGFGRELARSFRPKGAPLGEVRIAKLIK
jgi:putative membrane protein